MFWLLAETGRHNAIRVAIACAGWPRVAHNRSPERSAAEFPKHSRLVEAGSDPPNSGEHDVHDDNSEGVL